MAKRGRKPEAKISIRSIKRSRTFRKVLFVASSTATILYIGWRIFFTVPLEYGMFALILGLLLLGAEILAAIESMIQFRQILKGMIPELPAIPESWYPDVDILIATHNESAELLYKTINGCTYLDYPDKGKVHVYLCDDSDRPSMAELAKKMGIGYFGLSGNKQAKAGNLNNAMRQTHSPLIVTLDSDMIPTSDFLMKTVPYFFLPVVIRDKKTGEWRPREQSEMDPDFKIGFIQTPQSFYNPDLFQYNLFSEARIPNEQDYFFREVNVGRNADNGVIYAGSNTVLSRRALEEVGYIATTSITEDFLTGLRMQKKGYTTYAVPDELAHGLAPSTISSLLKQRERWGRGCIQALRQEHIVTSPSISLWTKLSYLATWSYWWAFARRFVYIISPIMFILFNLPVMGAFTWQIIAFWFPHYLLNSWALKSISSGVRNRHWSNVYDTILFPYLIGPMLFETMGIKKRKFVVTDKEKPPSRKKPALLLALPHLELFAATLVSLVICVQQSILMKGIYSPVIFFWLVVNAKNLVFAIFFAYGRNNFRGAERYYVSLPVEVKCPGRTIQAETTDISETGMAIKLKMPIYIPPDMTIELSIFYSKYRANMRARVAHASQMGDEWKYSLQIVDLDEHNRREYTQIVYDRGHTMPRELDPTLSVFDDFNINLTKRNQQAWFETNQPSVRTLPRIQCNIPFTMEDGRSGRIVDFNFHFVKLSAPVTLEADQRLMIRAEPGVVFYLGTPDDADGSPDGTLYAVCNREDFSDPARVNEIIEMWTKESDAPKSAARGFIVPVGEAKQAAE